MQKQSLITPRVIAQLFFILILMPGIPIWLTGRWNWWEVWLYLLISVGGFAASRWLAWRRHPDLLAERGRMLNHDDAQPWDKLLAPLIGVGGVLIPLAVGLEARFLAPLPYAPALKALGLVLILAGYALGSWALATNRFFSGMVRLQSERGQQVVTDGPYRIVRHPGYLGALITYAGTPLLLDSRWGFLPVLLLAVVLIIRTRLEDTFLQGALAGYADYAKKVKQRLIPGIW